MPLQQWSCPEPAKLISRHEVPVQQDVEPPHDSPHFAQEGDEGVAAQTPVWQDELVDVQALPLVQQGCISCPQGLHCPV